MKLEIIVVCTGISWLAGGVYAAENLALKDQKDKVSYSLGVTIGKSLKQQGVEVTADILARGLKDGLIGGKMLLTDAEVEAVMMAFNQEMQTKMEQRAKAQAEKNKQEGAAFLAANQKKPGVVTLPSGLQYKVITPGTGPTPKLTDTVTTQYRGTLLNGAEFDSSYKRGEPATFPVGGVIKGWTEALQLMKVGAKWQLFIPSELAYREAGAGQAIPPNSTLIFEIELLSIK